MFGRFSLRSFVRPRGEIRQGTSNGCPLPGGSWEHCPPNLPLKEGVTSTTLLKQLSEAGWVKIIYFDTDQTLSVLLIFQFFTQKLQMKIEHVPNYTYL